MTITPETPTTPAAAAADAPLRLDYANCLADRVGAAHGIDPAALDDAASTMREITRRLASMRAEGATRWRDLPFNPLRSTHLDAVGRTVEDVRDYFRGETPGGACRHLVVLGIGGSALGNMALQSALRPGTHDARSDADRTGPRLHVLDNVDPHLVGDVMRYIEADDPGLEHVLVNVISKSGETAETASQFIIFRQWLREHLGTERAGRHVVAITDPRKGTMRSIVDAEGYRSLPVPDGVGGRFSVLSPVGLFSAAMMDIDVRRLLDGAASMDARCTDESLDRNPAALLAWLLVTLARDRGKPNHVLMPYSNRLCDLADWYRQLWAESLGKRVDLDGREVHAGATPIKALGTTDQHSQVQLYREGPNDKVVGFVEIERFAPHEDVVIPPTLDVEPLRYLHGRTLGELLLAEKRATEYALVESRRPNFTLRVPAITEHAVGQFIMLWEVATACAGLLLNIDAYDQPAVETGKVATFGLMGRPGYEEWRDRVRATLAPTDRLA